MTSLRHMPTLRRPEQMPALTIPKILFAGHSYVQTSATELQNFLTTWEGTQGGTQGGTQDGWQGTLNMLRGSKIVGIAATQNGGWPLPVASVSSNQFGPFELRGPGIATGTRAEWGSVVTLSAALSTGAPITTVPVNPVQNPVGLQSGLVVTVLSGGNSQAFTLTAAAAAGATSLTVSSITPNFAYPANSPMVSPMISKPALRTDTGCAIVGGAFIDGRWSSKVAKAFHAEEINIGVGGAIASWGDNTTGGYAAQQVWLPRTKAGYPYMSFAPVAVFFIGVNGIGFYNSITRELNGIRTMLSWARNAYTMEDNNVNITYTGSWSRAGGSTISSGLAASVCTTSVGSAAIHIATPTDMLPGQAITPIFELFNDAASPSTQGVYQMAVNGTVVGTLDTRNAGITDAKFTEVCAPRIVCGRDFWPGQTIDITFPTPPGEAIFDCAHVEAEVPPLILLCKQPLLPPYAPGSGKANDHYVSQAGLTDAKVLQLNAGLESLAAEYPNSRVRPVDFSFMDHDYSLFSIADGLHFNYKGCALAASKIIQEIEAAGLTQDQVHLSAAYTLI